MAPPRAVMPPLSVMEWADPVLLLSLPDFSQRVQAQDPARNRPIPHMVVTVNASMSGISCCVSSHRELYLVNCG